MAIRKTEPGGAQTSDGHGHGKPEPIRLCKFSAALTVQGLLERTIQYAKNPQQYLETLLGSDTLEARKTLLNIPAKIDRDIYGSGDHKSAFESHMARLAGKEGALFFITGVQAQLAALKIHCERAGNRRVAWHLTSHLEDAEERSYEELYGLERRLLGRDRNQNPSVDEIKEVLSLPDGERPAVVLIEVPNRTLGSSTYTFQELETISSACKASNVRFHCDGARIWEIEPYYQKTAGKSLADIAGLFDSIYCSYYKGLQGAAGAMLLGEEELIREARVWQRRAGGNPITLMYEIADCERGFNENIGTFERKWEKMDEVQSQILKQTAKFTTKDGEQVIAFMVNPATCCQVHTLFAGYPMDELVAARDRVEAKMNVRVFERIRPKKTLDDMNKAEREAQLETNGNNVKEVARDTQHEIEWMIGPETVQLDTSIFVDAYVALCEELTAADATTKE